MRSNIYPGFLEKKLTMTDFLLVKAEKIVKNSISYYARSTKVLVFFFLIGKFDKRWYEIKFSCKEILLKFTINYSLLTLNYNCNIVLQFT